MKSIRVRLILGFAILIALNSFGQKIEYKDCKNDFSVKHYRDSIINETYSPLTAGVINFLIPTSGYHYIKEPLRGWCVLGIELIPLGVAFYGFAKSFGNGPGNIEGGEKLFNYGIIAYELIQIWSLYDVVKIAKIKNLAYQESKITMKIKPEFLFVNQNSKSPIAYGLSLNINF
jgi:hypothetical protein